MNTVNDRIKSIRKSLGLTQTKFGELISLKPSSISDLEKCRYTPRDSTLKFICSELNVDYIWLTTGEGDMFLNSSDSTDDMIDVIFSKESDLFKDTLKKFSRLDDSAIMGLNLFIESYMTKKK